VDENSPPEDGAALPNIPVDGAGAPKRPPEDGAVVFPNKPPEPGGLAAAPNPPNALVVEVTPAPPNNPPVVDGAPPIPPPNPNDGVVGFVLTPVVVEPNKPVDDDVGAVFKPPPNNPPDADGTDDGFVDVFPNPKDVFVCGCCPNPDVEGAVVVPVVEPNPPNPVEGAVVVEPNKPPPVLPPPPNNPPPVVEVDGVVLVAVVPNPNADVVEDGFAPNPVVVVLEAVFPNNEVVEDVPKPVVFVDPNNPPLLLGVFTVVLPNPPPPNNAVPCCVCCCCCGCP
jgi:hypothetical protein